MSRAPTAVTRLLESCRVNPALVAELEKYRRDVAVVFTDLKGSTEYFEKHGDAAGVLMLHECNLRLSEVVRRHGGRVIKTIGDSVMAIFDDCIDAVNAAIQMQVQTHASNRDLPAEEQMFVRIGLNYGAGIVKSDDVFGDVVNLASRVQSVAQPEQIVISSRAWEMISSTNVPVRSIGSFSLKGKESPVELFEVVWDDSLQLRMPASHTLITAPKFARVRPDFALQHLHADGTLGRTLTVPRVGLVVGRSEGLLTFPRDEHMAPAHGRFTVEGGQLFVEDTSGGLGVFVRLLSVFT